MPGYCNTTKHSEFQYYTSAMTATPFTLLFLIMAALPSPTNTLRWSSRISDDSMQTSLTKLKRFICIIPAGCGFGTVRFSPNSRHLACPPNAVTRLLHHRTSAVLKSFATARCDLRFSADKRWFTSGLHPVVYTISSAHQWHVSPWQHSLLCRQQHSSWGIFWTSYSQILRKN